MFQLRFGTFIYNSYQTLKECRDLARRINQGTQNLQLKNTLTFTILQDNLFHSFFTPHESS